MRIISACAVVAHQVGERHLAEHAPQRGVEQRRELEVRRLDRSDGLVEAQRVLDAVARERVDHETLLVGGDDFLRRILEVEDALVDADHRVDQRPLKLRPGSVTTRTGSPSRTTSACSVWRTTNSEL